MYRTGVAESVDSRLVSLRRKAEAVKFQRDATLRALWVAMDLIESHHPRRAVDAREMLAELMGDSAEINPFDGW